MVLGSHGGLLIDILLFFLSTPVLWYFGGTLRHHSEHKFFKIFVGILLIPSYEILISKSLIIFWISEYQPPLLGWFFCAIKNVNNKEFSFGDKMHL